MNPDVLGNREGLEVLVKELRARIQELEAENAELQVFKANHLPGALKFYDLDGTEVEPTPTKYPFALKWVHPGKYIEEPNP
jgi:hypothetical protein